MNSAVLEESVLLNPWLYRVWYLRDRSVAVSCGHIAVLLAVAVVCVCVFVSLRAGRGTHEEDRISVIAMTTTAAITTTKTTKQQLGIPRLTLLE